MLYGDIDWRASARVWAMFHESSIPYKVDVTALDLITDESFRRRVESEAVVLLTRKQIEAMGALPEFSPSTKTEPRSSRKESDHAV